MDVYFQIDKPVAVHVFEGKRDGGEVLPISKERGNGVNTGFACISPWYLYDNDVAVEVYRDKVAWVTGAIIMSDDFVYLKRAGSAVGTIVLVYLPPL